MKRVLSLLLVAGVAFSLGHFLRAPIHHAGAMGGGTLPVSGDANGDGILDIADAVYIIDYQLRGGPAPVSIVCPPAGLPATGQTKCYDDQWSRLPCDSAAFPGQDGFYQAGCPMESRFVDNGDGTVSDNCTGLMWQKDTADTSGNGSIGDEDLLIWREALMYCENLEFAGHSDWRLPNLRELQSIVNYGRFDPAIDPVFGALSVWYWSSSSYAHRPDNAWLVDFLDGHDYGQFGKADLSINFIRAVRNAP